MGYTDREKQLMRFFRRFISLDEDSRKEVACFVNSLPYSWNVVYFEIVNTTKMSLLMLNRMIENNFKNEKL